MSTFNLENYAMRNYLLKIMLTSFILLASFSIISFAEDQNQNVIISDDEARSIVVTYLDALSQGDTFTIKQLLGGKYLDKQSRLLSNPSYSNMLSKLYSSATSSIVNTEIINQKQIAVDARIELSPQEVIEPRFIISADEQQQLKIVDEIQKDEG